MKRDVGPNSTQGAYRRIPRWAVSLAGLRAYPGPLLASAGSSCGTAGQHLRIGPKARHPPHGVELVEADAGGAQAFRPRCQEVGWRGCDRRGWERRSAAGRPAPGWGSEDRRSRRSRRPAAIIRPGSGRRSPGRRSSATRPSASRPIGSVLAHPASSVASCTGRKPRGKVREDGGKLPADGMG